MTRKICCALDYCSGKVLIFGYDHTQDIEEILMDMDKAGELSYNDLYFMTVDELDIKVK
jgi:hypothetical protein